MIVRLLREEDLPAINDIYNHFITHTAITFDLEPWTIEERQAWADRFENGPERYKVFVAEIEGQIVGFAYNGCFNPKQAYDISSEVTIYTSPDVKIKGLGSQLMTSLLSHMREVGLKRAYSLITLPNPASLALHYKYNFKQVGQYESVGEKFGSYHSVAVLELAL